MALTMDSTLGDLMTDEAALKMFGERYPGALDDPNLKNSTALKLSLFCIMPLATQKGITKPNLEELLAELNAL